MKVLFVPIAIVGCGKSTVFRAVASLCPHFSHIENDTCASKADFYDKVGHALANPAVEAVLLDRNNHLPMHRKEIVTRYKGNNVLLVALLFVPPGPAKSVYATSWERISSRGDNHPQIKSATEKGKSKMILNSFARSFENYDPSWDIDALFDYVVPMLTGPELSRENIQKMMARYAEICAEHGLSGCRPEIPAMEEAIEKSLAFRV